MVPSFSLLHLNHTFDRYTEINKLFTNAHSLEHHTPFINHHCHCLFHSLSVNIIQRCCSSNVFVNASMDIGFAVYASNETSHKKALGGVCENSEAVSTKTPWASNVSYSIYIVYIYVLYVSLYV